jgi:hypothetical protein
MVLERKIWPVSARRTKDGPGGQGAPAPMRGSRAGFDVAFMNGEVELRIAGRRASMHLNYLRKYEKESVCDQEKASRILRW